MMIAEWCCVPLHVSEIDDTSNCEPTSSKSDTNVTGPARHCFSISYRQAPSITRLYSSTRIQRTERFCWTKLYRGSCGVQQTTSPKFDSLCGHSVLRVWRRERMACNISNTTFMLSSVSGSIQRFICFSIGYSVCKIDPPGLCCNLCHNSSVM